VEYLRADYEDLRADYEDLRADYEDLRRPFAVTADVPYTDVWDFATVQYRAGKHPCEKPLDLMRHIIRSSTRPDALVLDCFAGSGATLEAAHLEGRRYLGIEREARWVAYATARLATPTLRSVLVAHNPTKKPAANAPIAPRSLWEFSA
jgi:DNA modification methylase